MSIINPPTVSSQCTISDPLMVSPFNATNSYNFRGTCELTALMSCNGSRADFAVRVDFAADNSNGAVGVYKNSLRWISREDGTFIFYNGTENVAASDSTLIDFLSAGVTVRLNSSASTTVIDVQDGIGVTVVHNYGGTYIDMYVGNYWYVQYIMITCQYTYMGTFGIARIASINFNNRDWFQALACKSLNNDNLNSLLQLVAQSLWVLAVAAPCWKPAEFVALRAEICSA